MINLLYHSHTVVPAHLAELEAMGLVEPDEQILVALDGVLLDSSNRRLSGPTLHDYCLVSDLRVILWARDYGRHLCYAFPLAELTTVEGAGVDPLHAQIQLRFAAPDEEDQTFTLALLPLANLQAALALLHAASTAARVLAEDGVEAREAASEILAILGEQIYGHVDGLRPGEAPYRWPGASTPQPVFPGPIYANDPASLPPGQFYTAGRLARSAWDTLRRSIRDAELPLPFDLNSGSLRELTEAVRAINDLVHTVATNPSAQQMAMAFINRNNGHSVQGMAPGPQQAEAPQRPQAQAQAPAARHEEGSPAATPIYHEIPLRRRAASATDEAEPQRHPAPQPGASVRPAPAVESATRAQTPAPPDRRDIPLRRRGSANVAKPFGHGHLPTVRSGSGDAGPDDRPSAMDDRH